MDALKTKIEIIDLCAQAHIGCTEQERSQLQKLNFDVIIYFDGISACQSDKLEETIDYMALRKVVMDTCASTKFALIEKLAWTCVDKFFATFPSAEEIHFKVKKFPMKDATNVGFGLVARR